MKYNKLVRDNVPAASERGEKPVTRALDTDEYRQELRQ